MKKQKILNICSSVLQLLIVVALFIPNFVIYAFETSGVRAKAEFGLFADFTNIVKGYSVFGHEFTTAFMTITSVLLIILTIVATVYVVLIILDALGVKFKISDKLKRILSIIAIVCGVLVLICMLITSLTNVFTTKNAITGEILRKEITYGTGTCFVFASIIGGVLGLMANKTSKKSK